MVGAFMSLCDSLRWASVDSKKSSLTKNGFKCKYSEISKRPVIGRWGIEALESQVKSVKTWHANERAASIYDISSGASPACNHAQVPATVTATQWRIDIAMGSAPALVL